MADTCFHNLPELLTSGDVLVFNNSRVLQARLFGKIAERATEVLLLENCKDGHNGESGNGLWRCLGKPLKKFRPGAVITFEGSVQAIVVERVREFDVILDFGNVSASKLFQIGSMPIPPYIRGGRGDDQDAIDYQTAFAKIDGSVAAPTASLHFTEPLLTTLRKGGVAMLELTLHVGPASFRSVWDEAGEFHPPSSERGVISNQVLQQIHDYKLAGKRIIAVGTTVVRALESIARRDVENDGTFETELFITPGFEFQIVDAMITNFHQPRSSHLLLVEAFLSRALLEAGYDHALQNEYRFLSYGDGMFIE